MRIAVIVAVALCVTGSVAAQRTVPWPDDAGGSGGFSARRLRGPVTVDGRTWIAAEVNVGRPDVWRPAKADYQLRFTDPDEEGDFERWALMLERAGSQPVSLTAGGKTGFAYVTPDARFVFTEPLIVIDVRRWRRYALYIALGIHPYVSIDAISRDGHRLLLHRADCAVDCRQREVEYFELTLPS